MSDTLRSDRTARNAIVLSAAEVIGKAGSLVYTILAARALSPAGYGAFAYAVAMSLIIASVAAWGFDELLMQRASREPERLQEVTSQSISSKLTVGIPIYLVATLVLAPVRPSAEASISLMLVFAAAMFDLLSDTGRAAATVRERLTGVSVTLVVNRIVTAGLAVAALALGGGLVAISAAYLVGSASGMIGTTFVLRGLGLSLRPQGHPRAVAGLVRRSGALGLTTILGLLLFRIDTVLLGAIRGDDAVGRYSVAYRMIENTLFVAWSVGRASFPMLAQATSAAAVQRVLRRGSGLLATVYVPFGCVAALRADAVIRLLFGSDYGAAATASLQILAFTPLAFGVAYMLGQVLIARGDFTAALWVFGGAAAVNVIANLLLIPSLGERGAALTTIASYAFEAVLAWWLVRRRIGPTSPLAAWSPAVVGGVVMTPVLLLVRVNLAVDIAAAGAVYAVAWWALARIVTPEQTDQVRRIVRNLIPGDR